MAFPTSPTTGQTYTLGSVVYTYNGIGWVPGYTAGGSALPTATAPVTAIPLDGNKVFNADTTSSTTALTIAAGQVEGGSCSLAIKGDGNAWGGITGALKASGSAAFDTTQYAVNHVLVWVDRGRVRYTVSQSDPIEMAYPPSAPAWGSAPSLSLAVVGIEATALLGTLTGFPTPTLTYQWTANGSNIPGATSALYTPQVAYVGQSLRCVVTATNASGSAVATSNPVTIDPGIVALTSIFTASGVTQGAAGSYTITASGLKGSSSVSAAGNYELIADLTGNSAPIAFGVASSNTAGAWTGGFLHAVIDDSSFLRWSYVEAGTQQNPANPYATTSANRRARVKRVGTTVTMDVSNDAGVNWINLYTSTGDSGTRYPVIGSYTANGSLKLSGQGFA